MTPPRRFNAMMTWAPFSSQPRVVMLGGDAPAAMVFSPELSAIVLYGGIAGGGTVMRDMWTLTTDPVTQDDIWVEIEQIGELPVARQDPRLAAHRPVDSLVLHAGTSASGTRLDDTWLFQYRSLVPDEICDNGSDDDGDRRIDGKDPDCL